MFGFRNITAVLCGDQRGCGIAKIRSSANMSQAFCTPPKGFVTIQGFYLDSPNLEDEVVWEGCCNGEGLPQARSSRGREYRDE